MPECVGGLRLFRVAGCLILLLVAAPFLSAQNVINVPANQPTIQAAINVANNGDTVMVAPGTYYETINFIGKAITVTSSGGPSVTTINGSAAGSVVTIDTSEGPNSVLRGFTITNGNATANGLYNGGGVYIWHASPTISGNVITGNVACSGGGGIDVEFSSAMVQGNTISNNSQKSCSGGVGGGGIYIGGTGSVQIIGNTISNNSWSTADGGGISLNAAGTPTIENNTIYGNTAYSQGGGMAIVNDSNAMIVQNLIFNNRSQQGGAIYFGVPYGSRGPFVINNTIVNNTGIGDSGIYASGFDAQTEFFNNLLISGSGQPVLYCDTTYGQSPATILSNDAMSSASNGFGGGCAGSAGVNGNIAADPLFFDPASNFHIQFGSPTVDAGNNSAPGLPATDFDGNPRVVDGNGDGIAVVDIGAYELSPTTITLAPNSLTFGPQPLGTTSASQAVTLTNTGNQKLLFAISVSANFAETDNCGSSLASGASCSINVSFSPAATGNITGNVTLKDTASGSPHTVALAGTGGAPVASLTPTSLNFGTQPLGTTSAAQTITLSNTGEEPMAISSITSSGDFAETNACGATLAAGASCSINVTFAPAAAGARSGSVTVADNASGSPQSVPLTGTGAAPSITLTPASLAFGGQLVGTTSAVQSTTLTNTGNAPLTISAISVTGDFAQTNTCGTTLAAAASCSINVTFTPTAVGTRSGSVTVTDNASGSPQSVSLAGTGTAPGATLAPASLAFGGQLVGTTSAVQSTTLSNTGNAPLTISAISVTGDFAQTNTCGTTLAAAASCSINVTFTPTAVGTRSGSVTVTDNASGSPQSVSLAGTGTAPMATLSPATLTFGSQVIGTASPTQSATLSNTGTAPLTISGITITGDFSQTNNCGATLAAGANCTIGVTFTPSVTGVRSGSLSVSSNSLGGTVSAALSGNGAENAPTFSPTSLTFSSQVVGTKSGGQDVHLTANGPGPLAISSIMVTGPFLESNNCPASLNAGSNCNITINFLPSAGGAATGAIVVIDNGLRSPQTVPLSGSGLDFTLSASPLSVTVNAGSTAQYTVTATAVGGSFDHSVNLTCSGLPAQSKCQFSPGGISPKTGSASSGLAIQTKSGANGTPSGTYAITITGASDPLKHTITVTLTVN